MTTDDDALAASLANMAGHAAPSTGRRCKAGRILDKTTPLNRATILDYLHDDTVTDAILAAMLRAGGHPISASQLSRHRSGACICDTRDNDEQDAA